MIGEPLGSTTEVELTRRRFTAAEFLHLAEIGFLREEERVELIRGEIVEMSPINEAHASTTRRLIRLLTKTFGEQVIIGAQDPVQLGGDSLPQPNITVLRARNDFYSTQHPGPKDIVMLIEVSDRTLNYDRRVKSVLYAQAAVLEYWIVNLRARRVEVYREPQSDGYRITIRFQPGESLSLLAFPDVALKVDDILGKV